MNIAESRTLLDYHYWARDRLLDAVEKLAPEQFTRGMGSSFASVRDTLAHIYGAEWIWYMRWMGESPPSLPKADAFTDVPTVRSIWKHHEAKMRALLDSLDETGLLRVIEYRNTEGQTFASVFWHMLQHVVNHATYHRGQITTLLRQLGATPPQSMDLIAYYRER
jgi:uncharacterized damage-inducible protein DinB